MLEHASLTERVPKGLCLERRGWHLADQHPPPAPRPRPSRSALPRAPHGKRVPPARHGQSAARGAPRARRGLRSQQWTSAGLALRTDRAQHRAASASSGRRVVPATIQDRFVLVWLPLPRRNPMTIFLSANDEHWRPRPSKHGQRSSGSRHTAFRLPTARAVPGKDQAGGRTAAASELGAWRQ